MAKAKTVKNEVKENKIVEEIKEEVKEDIKDVNESEAAVEENEGNTQAGEEAQEVKANAGVIGVELYKRHADAVKDAKQFYQCQLPSISYYSKRTLCDAVDTMKRMCDRSNGVEATNMCIELLETAIAYLYNRKVNG